MDELIYKYDIFNESDIHCKECKSCGNPKSFQLYCEKTGCTVQDKGYCNYAKRRDDEWKSCFKGGNEYEEIL